MRLIAHFDMDAFFAAIEARDRPELQGQPIAVGADPQQGHGRGVVSTANYAARAYGLHSALPISQAWRLSESARRRGLPPVVFLPVRMSHYAAVSDRIMAIFRRTVPIVEPASIDEAYLDLSHTGSLGAAEALCRAIKDTIRTEERLTASVGLGPNKLVAKIASGIHKPDGLTVVPLDTVQAFLDPLPIRTIPGIGPKTEAALARQQVALVTDLRAWSRERLVDEFGKRGLDFYDKVRGLDDEPVSPDWTPKSVGEQETFDTDTRDGPFLMEQLRRMSEDVVRRLQAEEFSTYRTIVLTVRFEDFTTVTRSHTLAAPASDARTLQAEALKLFLPFLDRRANPDAKRFRLLGLRVERLE